MSLRLGAGKVRQVDTPWLWAQGVIHRREATIREKPRTSNETDLMTKFLNGRTEISSNRANHGDTTTRRADRGWLPKQRWTA